MNVLRAADGVQRSEFCVLRASTPTPDMKGAMWMWGVEPHYATPGQAWEPAPTVRPQGCRAAALVSTHHPTPHPRLFVGVDAPIDPSGMVEVGSCRGEACLARHRVAGRPPSVESTAPGTHSPGRACTAPTPDMKGAMWMWGVEPHYPTPGQAWEPASTADDGSRGCGGSAGPWPANPELRTQNVELRPMAGELGTQNAGCPRRVGGDRVRHHRLLLPVD